MDKRRHRRLDTRLDVHFSIANLGIFSATLCDYGRGGAFLSLQNHPLAESRRKSILNDAALQIHFSLDERDFSLDGMVAHVGDDGIGVRFINQDALAFSALAELARRQASVMHISPGAGAVTPAKAPPSFDIGGFLKHWRGLCEDHFCNGFNEIITELVGDISREDVRARESLDSGFSSDAATLLTVNSAKLATDVFAALASAVERSGQLALNGGVSGNSTVFGHEHGALKLVDKNDFEEWLSVKVAISRTESALREHLFELDYRWRFALGIKEEQASSPFSPAVYYGRINDDITSMQIDPRVKRHLFKRMSELSIPLLMSTYGKANESLISMGVLKGEDISRRLAELRRQEESKSDASVRTDVPGKKPADEQAKPARSEFERSDRMARDAFATANRLFHMFKSRSLQGQALADSMQPAPEQLTQTSNRETARLIQAIAGFCRDLAKAPQQTFESQSALLGKLEQGVREEGLQVDEETRMSLGMIGSLVENIADEQGMTGDLRTTFSNIQVPLLALQLSDPEMFSSEQHPIREFLNYLAILAEPESPNFRRNADVVKNTVVRLLECDPINEAAVAQLSSGLRKEFEREKSVIERNVERIVESCDGRERIRHANDLLVEELARRLPPGMQPVLLLELLDLGWRELLRLCLLRDGAESRSWQTALQVIDDLLVYLGERPVASDRAHFNSHDLITVISKGLHKTTADPQRIDSLIDRLAHGIESPNLNKVFTDSFQFKPAPGPASKIPNNRWSRRVARLKTGQWLEYGVRSGKKKLCQIVWVSDPRDRFVLANQQGVKVAELTDTDFSRQLAEKDITLLGTGPSGAVEKGLDSLIQKIYDKLTQDAAYDQLTGLLSRKEFERTLAQSVARAKRNKSRYALVYFDVLQFSVINKVCGYEGGDQFLLKIAEKIREAVVEKQVSGRIGGNEFAIITQVQNDSDAFRFACKIKAEIESMRFVWAGASYSVVTAAAVCSFGEESNHVFELLRTVESGVQFAKSAGYKEVQMVKPGDERFQTQDSIISWVAKINDALDNGGLRLRCQKIAPIGDKAESLKPHYEILLTVMDANGAQMPPAEFIRAAETYGRMTEVDRWVITEVLLWMKENPKFLDRIGGFAINLSGHTINDESFMDFIFEQFVRHEVARNKIIFEITETTAVANLEEAADFILEMKEIGCRFSLDDFGAGQSSYAYLKALPVDFIKIDGAFVRNIDTSSVDYALVKSITEMGHYLGKRMVAEFVSDEKKYNKVLELGVDYVQGYHVGKPQPIEELPLQ